MASALHVVAIHPWRPPRASDTLGAPIKIDVFEIKGMDVSGEVAENRQADVD